LALASLGAVDAVTMLWRALQMLIDYSAAWP